MYIKICMKKENKTKKVGFIKNKEQRAQFLKNLRAEVQEYKNLQYADPKTKAYFDAKKIRKDWESLGNDIRLAIEKLEKDIGQNEK